MKSLFRKLHLDVTVVMLLGLGLGLFLFTFKIIGFDLNYFPGDLADGRLNLYFLEHAHKFFSGKLMASLWDAPFMYPEKNVLAFSDNLLGSAPIYSLLRLFGADMFASYQIWFVIVTALNYITAFYFLRYLFKDNYAAMLGAFVFAFSLALHSQIVHAQTFPRFAIPIAFYFALRFSEALKPKFLFLTILSVVYQIYCGIYLGFMLVIPLGIFLGLILADKYFIKKDVEFNLRWLIQILTSLLINVMILIPLMLPYMERKIPPSIIHFRKIMTSLPTVESYLFSMKGSLFWDFLSKTGMHHKAWWNHQIFAGGVATISFIVAVFWVLKVAKKGRFKFIQIKFTTIQYLILSGFITFLIYLRIDALSAYFVVYWFPGFNAMRALSRIVNIQLLIYAVSIGFVFTSITNRKSKLRLLFFVIAVFLVVSDNYFFEKKSYKTEVSVAKARTERLENVFSKIPVGSVVSYEPEKLDTKAMYYQIDAMLLSQRFDLFAINGYSGTSPKGYSPYWRKPCEETRNKYLKRNQIEQKELFVITASDKILTVNLVPFTKSQEASKTQRVEKLIKHIRSNPKWMKNIEQKAIKKNISVDSMLVLDAVWTIKNEK